MHASISIYEDIAAATARMREAALRADWDGLVEAESACAVHIRRAREAVVPVEHLDAESRTAKARLIRRMLADGTVRAVRAGRPSATELGLPVEGTKTIDLSSSFVMPGFMIKMSDSHVTITPSPQLAADNDAVYGGLLGLGRDELTKLRKDGVI